MKFKEKDLKKESSTSPRGLEGLLKKASKKTRHWLDTAQLEYLRKQQDSKTNYVPDHFHPSSCGEAPRMLYLIFTGQNTSDFSDYSLEKMQHGNWVHDKNYDMFTKMGVLKAKEISIKIESPIPISTRCDAIIFEEGTRGDYLVEIKSIESNGFTDMKSPDFKHLVQWMLGSKLSGVNKGCLFYENKNNQRKKIFDLVNDRGDLIVKKGLKVIATHSRLMERIDNKLSYVRHCCRENKLPIRCNQCLVRCRNYSKCEELEKTMEVKLCDLEIC